MLPIFYMYNSMNPFLTDVPKTSIPLTEQLILHGLRKTNFLRMRMPVLSVVHKYAITTLASQKFNFCVRRIA